MVKTCSLKPVMLLTGFIFGSQSRGNWDTEVASVFLMGRIALLSKLNTCSQYLRMRLLCLEIKLSNR